LKFEVLDHPGWSPDFASSDFHMFGLLKWAIWARRFADGDEVKETVHEWLRTQPKQFFMMISEFFWTARQSALRCRETIQESEFWCIHYNFLFHYWLICGLVIYYNGRNVLFKEVKKKCIHSFGNESCMRMETRKIKEEIWE
jgi:hypothetical protein